MLTRTGQKGQYWKRPEKRKNDLASILNEKSLSDDYVMEGTIDGKRKRGKKTFQIARLW